MRIKKYTAASMKEALLIIKQDLGEDALILKTRKLPRKLFSLGDKASIEVTAAVDDNASKTPTPLPPLTVKDTGVYKRPKPSPKKTIKEKPLPKLTKEAKADEPLAPLDRFQILEIKENIREMKELMASILATGESTAAGGFAGPWAILYKRLIDSEIRQEIAEDFIHKLKNTTNTPDKSINKNFISVLAQSFPVSGPLTPKSNSRPQLIAFVGPTGAGKTTSIAKLAAYYSLDKKNRVSIITADTYRIAAIEQIRAFTEIIDISLQVIFSPEEVPEALEACSQDDLVFIDTAGRSQRHTQHMKELEVLFHALSPDQVHLVLSATTKDSDLRDIVKRYKNLSISHLLFTKLDETVSLGNVFNTVSTEAIPVSYLTAGQSVPDDIELAQAGRFVQRLLERSSL